MLDDLPGHHRAHVRPAAGVADHGGASADEGDGPVARHLQPLHQSQGHKVAHVQAVGGGVKADVKHGLPVVDDLADLLLVGHLGDQAPGLSVPRRSPSVLLLSSVWGQKKTPLCFTEGDEYRGTTSVYRDLSVAGLVGRARSPGRPCRVTPAYGRLYWSSDVPGGSSGK